ncbi:Pentatricopeptide repeat [Lasallia pustulata]|uniref:Pentatricopeptide repeat n=1 Tax=Lasallia pustulata TaxID=136370 RepID=A0A1W5CT61_9LECA|nr:Pentatricopeptide repeat [Lasallia pustulata]
MVEALLDVLIRERHEVPSPQLYLALILANTSPHGSPEEVSKLLQEMEESGIILDSAMYHAILKVLAMHPSYTFRSEILHEMLHQRWFTLSNDGWHDFVAGLIKDRQLEMALDKFEQMNVEGIRIQPWLHDMMVYVLCEAEEIDEALKIMRQRTSNGEMMISATLWYSFLDAASRALHLEATLYAWRKRVESGYLNPPSGICLNVLATASRHGNFRLATDVFRILGNRTYTFQLHHYEALLEAYINGYDLRSALTLLCVMYSSGVPPTESSTRALFIYLRQKPFWPTKAFQILKELKDSKWDIPTPAVNCIIEACVHQNDLAQAIEHYKNLHTLCSAGPTTATFNVLLRGCSQTARKDLAMFLASEMLALNVPPDALTYDRLILVCLDADASYDTCNTDTGYKDALRYLAEMKGMGWFPRRGTVVALVKTCCEVGDDMTWELLGEMERRGMDVPGLEAWLEKNWTGDEGAKARRLAKMA